MKKQIAVIVIATVLCYLFFGNISKRNAPQIQQHFDSFPLRSEEPIRVVFLQDVTRSILRNGIKLISPTVFAPYFNDVHRTIEVNFGIISGLPSNQFTPISLPKATFKKPVSPDIRGLALSDQQKVKGKYLAEARAYEADSVQFYSDREARIQSFCSAVDSCLEKYRKNLSHNTDVYTAVKIANEIFNYSEVDSARNFLLVNGDGFDTHNRTIAKLTNKAEVYLIGANVGSKTSIENIITKRFAYPEQGIQFTLK